LRAWDTAGHAAGAITAALRNAGDFGSVQAAGIDSPLFWVTDGDRMADKSIRCALKRLGASNVSGTVSHVNSLRGACLCQGIMTAHLLRRELPDIRITESHPKALLWLLHVARGERPIAKVGIGHLSDLIESESQRLSDHERDAALGGVGGLGYARQAERLARPVSRSEKPLFSGVACRILDARPNRLISSGSAPRKTLRDYSFFWAA
jgi:hypothetical protein